jgi:phospholipase/carboxylesterase
MVCGMDGEELSQDLAGQESTVIPGRFGEQLTVADALYSKEQAQANTRLPMFLLLHGWGSTSRIWRT